MLVLTRAVDEVLRIGDAVEIKIVAVRGGKVRLGVTAPRSVRVDRAEVRAAREAAEGRGDGEAGGTPAPRPAGPPTCPAC